ncbi:MAG TPA: alpha/beta family hydrolase [Acidimicrobiia bacterium]|nr:alpha/beta family hydrolase [Acidimicrobiia bacterium]
MNAYTGPTSGADRAVLLAHGAGSDHQTPALVAVADALAAAGIPSLRFDYPYKAAGRRAPDRPPVLAAATREAAAELAERSGLPLGQLVLGGRSMGGRIGSLVVADEDDPQPALGLLLLGYPLHPAGKPERRRDGHFPRLDLPVCFVSGTRDSLAPQVELTRAVQSVPGPVTLHWLDSADHGYRPLKASGRTIGDVLAEAAETSVTWVQGLDASAPPVHEDFVNGS